jgi:invasion protein IalB
MALRRTPLLLALAVLATTNAASAAAKKDAPATPVQVAVFGDWGVYVGGSGKGKICYLLDQPKVAADSKRDKVYAFISDRPGEGVRNEVSFIMGGEIAGAPDPAAKANAKSRPEAAKKPAAPIATPVALVGDMSFDMAPKGADLWIQNPANEPKLIDAMRRGVAIVVKATLKKGGAVADSYSLKGFDEAIARLTKECGGK